MELFNFNFSGISGWGINLDYYNVEWFDLENWDHSVIFAAPQYCILNSGWLWALLHFFYGILAHSSRYNEKWKSLHHVRLFVTPWKSPWNSPTRNTGVDSCFFLQGIFPIQGSNPGILHWRQILYYVSHQGSPISNLTHLRIYWYLPLLSSTTVLVVKY